MCNRCHGLFTCRPNNCTEEVALSDTDQHRLMPAISQKPKVEPAHDAAPVIVAIEPQSIFAHEKMPINTD